MCSKCVELDRKIEHCRRLASSSLDQNTVNGLEALIEQLRAERVALHPDSKQGQKA
jgi:hypothetical protein